MSAQQARLNKVWHSMTIFERKLDWMGNFMGSHRRWHNSVPVLEQEEAAAFEMPAPDDWTAPDLAPKPQDILIKQVESCVNQTGEIWIKLGKLGRQLEGVKRRVQIYDFRRGLAPGGSRGGRGR